ncbi:MAG: hydroxymethylbilane synthase, partial [Ectothiorhodospiraceae bacterium]|nr:hydroxymethylbilane synthase [Ectothiorhodospiraceae bacterium]
IAGHAWLENDVLHLHGLVGRPDGNEVLHEAVSGDPADAEDLGAELARRLLARGADRILSELGLIEAGT